MTDVSKMDIAERLRGWSTYDDPPGVTLDDLLNEAADEIDRLSMVAMEFSVNQQKLIAERDRIAGCDHDWMVWPETDGQSQRCMKCGAYRNTPSHIHDGRQAER